jgi:site-specific DNA-methyltransferase (adenine-specific)
VASVGASAGTGHPAAFPLALAEWLVTFAPEGGLVLDPFAGSATTGVACLQTGRRFIGVEVSPEYHRIAARRLDEARARLPAESA